MSAVTKYGKRGIAALCGATVLFVGEMEPMTSFAEQTEMDLSTVQEEAVSETIQQVTLETQSPEMGNVGESFTEASEVTSESSAEGVQTPQETGNETVQTDPRSDALPEQSETSVENDTPSTEKPAESETGQTGKPLEKETGHPQETAPPQTEQGSTSETTWKEPETSESTTETKQTETSPEIPGTETGVSEEVQTEYFFPEYDETETEIIGIGPSLYEGALAVISSAMNRTESPKWGYEGGNALAQLTAAGQYCYSIDNYWIPRLDGNVPAYVKQAVYDCLNNGIRNHTHTSFRSRRQKTAGTDAVQVGGNWYFDS